MRVHLVMSGVVVLASFCCATEDNDAVASTRDVSAGDAVADAVADGDGMPGADGSQPGEDGPAPVDTASDPPPGDGGGGPPPGGWALLAWEECEGGGRVLEVGPDDYRDVLDGLEPGDTMRLRPGQYLRGLPIRRSGAEGQCIVIEGVPGMERPVIRGSDAFNLIELYEASWVKVRGIDLQGDGLAGFGVAAQGGDSGFAHHIVVEDLHMTGFGGDQQIVGISTKSTCWDWVIRGNTIIGAGTGIYLGDSDGTSPFIRGLVEFNLVVDTIGYNMQIKHQVGRPELAGMPTGPSDTVIRYNVFSKESNGSTGDSARPNLLLGHLPLSGSGSSDRYLVYGNFFYENPTENLFQAEGNVIFYNNVMVNTVGGALSIQPHNDVPREVDVFFNTVIAAGTSITVTGGASQFSQRVQHNAVFATAGIDAESAADNFEGSLADAASRLVSPPPGGLDIHPLDGMLGGAPDLVALSGYLDGALDFDGRVREGPTIGAYAGPADATSWALGRTLRPYRP